MSHLPLDLYVLTFNCARTLLDIDVFAESLKHSFGDRNALPDIIFLSLQEIAPIPYSFLGGSLLAPYFARFVKAVCVSVGDSGPSRHIITHNVGMTAIMVFAKPELSMNLQWIQTAEVGVGWSECGNKGAAGVRFGYSAGSPHSIPVTLVAAHLAPAEDAVRRRNQDWENIVRRLVFENVRSSTASLSRALPPEANPDQEPLLGRVSSAMPSKDTVQGMFIPGSPIIFAGDLNYRTSDVGPKPEEYKLFPQPRTDPNDALHFSRLLRSDQLERERKAGRTLQLLEEESIDFPPTYKFSEKQQETMRSKGTVDGQASSWYWSTHRFPSWCDRVLFSSSLKNSAAFKTQQYSALPIQPTSDHRPVNLYCQIDLQLVTSLLSNQAPPFPLDSDWESRRQVARYREIAIGLCAYLGLTWEGNGILVASLLGTVGSYLVLRSLIAV